MEKVQGIRSIIRKYIIDGDVKNSMGNGEAKEFICMTYGHELKGDYWREWGYWSEKGKRGKIGVTVMSQSIKYI